MTARGTPEEDAAVMDDLAAIFARILARSEREIVGLPAAEPMLPQVTWAEVKGAALRTGAVLAAQARGHTMSAFARCAPGRPEAGVMAVCTHERCSCLIYSPQDGDTVTVAYIDRPCPHEPLPLGEPGAAPP